MPEHQTPEHQTPEHQAPEHQGVHRAATPEQTLARLLPLLPAMGVTRVALQTGLDTLGVPVAAAVRPNSRSLAVHQGKGLTPAAAKVSAIMEAAELFHAETCEAPLRRARPDEIGPAVDVARLPRAAGGPDPAGERLLWVEGTDLMGGARLWVPHETVHADFTLPQPAGSYVFQATTNGLGAGNTVLEAVTHALCETVERDAVALWHAAGRPQDGAVDPDSVHHPACAALLRHFAAAGVQAALWDLSRDTGPPVFLCLLVPPDGGLSGIEPELGSGCHPDPGAALSRAVLEAAQARVTRISGARDDFAPESYGASARAARAARARLWLAAARRRPGAFRPGDAGPTPRHDLDRILDGLHRAGCGAAVWVDLSKPALGVPVGRVVVPGLEGPYMPETGYVPGPRARTAAGAAPVGSPVPVRVGGRG